MPSTATSKFYLAVFALFGTRCLVRATSTPTIATHRPDVCALDPQAKVSDACASYADLNTLNDRLQPFVRNLANNSDFFSYYRLNLYNKECPFWNDESGLCGNIACAVTTVDNQEDLPKIWRAEELSKLEGPKAKHPGRKQQKERDKPLLGQLGEDVGESCVVEYDDECDDRDYCVPEDESASSKGEYVSLADNPERYTGYAGEGAHQVWAAIYNENCFSSGRSSRQSNSDKDGTDLSGGALFQNQAQAKQDFKQVIKAHDLKLASQSGQSIDEFDSMDECLEKRVFYRVISGMHASISTHLCNEYLNQTTGQWEPNLQCYKDRLHTYPERISNIYFNYALVLRAVSKLKDYIQDYTFCTGDPVQDNHTKYLIQRLARVIPSGPEIFDESVMFRDQTADGLVLKEDFRNRFRNVSRIMDCVGCDKCRLWGKIQTAGFGTALKVLFEFDKENKGDDKPLLRRHELVALINTLDKISSALKAIDAFQKQVGAEFSSNVKIDSSSTSAAETSQAKSALPVKPIIESKASPKAKPSNNFDELDALDDFDEPQDQPQSLSDDFWEEFTIVTKALVWVLKSWARLPAFLFTIAKSELMRVFDFWVGRQVRPRVWEIRFPSPHEEL